MTTRSDFRSDFFSLWREGPLAVVDSYSCYGCKYIHVWVMTDGTTSKISTCCKHPEAVIGLEPPSKPIGITDIKNGYKSPSWCPFLIKGSFVL